MDCITGGGTTLRVSEAEATDDALWAKIVTAVVAETVGGAVY